MAAAPAGGSRPAAPHCTMTTDGVDGTGQDSDQESYLLPLLLLLLLLLLASPRCCWILCCVMEWRMDAVAGGV